MNGYETIDEFYLRWRLSDAVRHGRREEAKRLTREVFSLRNKGKSVTNLVTLGNCRGGESNRGAVVDERATVGLSLKKRGAP